MPTPVKLSEPLVRDARVAAAATERSLTGQVEYWARLGRAAELVLRAPAAIRLSQMGAARPLSECLAAVGTAEGRKLLASFLSSRPYPQFAPVPGKPGFFAKTEKDGSSQVGKFVGREFRPLKAR